MKKSITLLLFFIKSIPYESDQKGGIKMGDGKEFIEIIETINHLQHSLRLLLSSIYLQNKNINNLLYEHKNY